MRTRTAASGDVGCFFYFFCFFLCFFFLPVTALAGAGRGGGTRTPPLSLPHPHPQAVSAAGGFIARGGEGAGVRVGGAGANKLDDSAGGAGNGTGICNVCTGGGNCVSCTHTYIRTYLHPYSTFFIFSSSDGRTDYDEISWWLHLTYPALAPLAEFPS